MAAHGLIDIVGGIGQARRFFLKIGRGKYPERHVEVSGKGTHRRLVALGRGGGDAGNGMGRETGVFKRAIHQFDQIF